MDISNDKADYTMFPNRYIDAIERTDNYFLPVLQDIAEHVRERTVIDVGCGSGRYTACLAETYCCRVDGIDGNDYALEKALAKGFNTVYQVGDLSNDSLPVDTAAYDVAVNKDVLEHLTDPLHLLSEINRILKPDGRLLLHVPNHFPLTGRIRFLFNNNIDPFGFCLGAKRWENPHIRFFRYEDIAVMLSSCGFRILKNLSYHFPAIPGLRFLPGRLGPLILRHLTLKHTTNFCCGFTVLTEKKGQP